MKKKRILYVYDFLVKKNENIESNCDIISFNDPEITNITYRNDYELNTKFAYKYITNIFNESNVHFLINEIDLNESIKRNLLHVFGAVTVMTAIKNIVKNYYLEYDKIEITTYNDLLFKELIKFKNIKINCKKIPIKKSFGTFRNRIKKLATKDSLIPKIEKEECLVFAQHRVTYDAITSKEKEGKFVILNKGSSDRIKDFILMLKNINIDYDFYEGLKDKWLSKKILFQYLKNRKQLKTIKSKYLQFLMQNILFDSIFDLYRLNEILNAGDIKKILISREYDGISDILCKLCKKNNIQIENYQHGAAYLGDMNFDKFYVFGEYFKAFYIQNSRSEMKQFKLKDKAFKTYYNISSDFYQDINTIKEKYTIITVFGQYLCSILTYAQKKEFALFLNKLLDENPNYFLLIKKHPNSKDNIFEENISGKRMKIDKNIYHISQYFQISDFCVSIFSTALLESIFNNIPVICYNKKEFINNNLISKILKNYTVASTDEFVNLTLDKESLLKEQKKDLKYYYNY